MYTSFETNKIIYSPTEICLCLYSFLDYVYFIFIYKDLTDLDIPEHMTVLEQTQNIAWEFS